MAFDPNSSGTSRSSPTSTTARARWPISFCSSPGAITLREFREQLLDDMDLERERGITIKARAVAINYTLDGQEYELNLIDTPGHVDFHYEVSRSLAACEGAILLVDATQGVQAQTVANAFAAINADLAIVPALNKIDMQAARPDAIKRGDRERRWGSTAPRCFPSAARPGLGVPDLFRAVIDRVPHAAGRPQGAAPGPDLRLEVRRLRRASSPTSGSIDGTAQAPARKSF